MTALDALRNADVSGALESLKAEIRKQPQEPKHRVFLFQLFAVAGDWERALTQLNVARDLSADAQAMAQTYQQALQCEALRSQVFAGAKSPLLFGTPEPWMALLLEAAKAAAGGRWDDARRLREEAFETAPATAGVVRLRPSPAPENEEDPGVPFAWVADADSRLGPMLEAIVNGKYYWIPFSRIARVDFEPPTDLRDLVWLPAHFTWTNGGEAVGLVPTRYAGSESSPDDSLRLARKTEWRAVAEDTFFGLGQRILTTDADEHPLLQIASLTFDGP